MAPSAVFVNVLLVVWLAYGGYISARTYRGGGTGDRGTRFVFFAGIFAPFAIGFAIERAGIGLVEPAWAVVLGWAGGCVMLVGIVVWMRAIATLGKLFSVNVDITDDHRIIDTGAYAHVRHPAYAGMLTVMLGYGVASGDWLVAIVFVAVPLAAFLYRISVEERALLERFGDAYRDYMRRTKRLVPYVY